ncbi:hypothetical protein PFICI_08458 [Pestalotiopsis fici W106-1]|uniref:Uncharacterized protein n=1 Tax=Pestalotiopsis fici (strain W106-1 / CGMCC3.15140) TaxID=1229662 RepID=W3X4J3_PESFW|nr:uncharacterized protein PFICI_08458 [Pestalotiopsis fici W106-1]ETS80929.1 hypothetical protein PFICI_08458 [Pestalotiopsis fici W106-1]
MSETRVEPVAPARTAAAPPTQPTAPPNAQSGPMLYQPYPYAQPPFSQQPRIIPFNKTHYWAKIGLTAASLVFCVILLGLSVAISIGPGYDSWNITIYWIGPLIGIAGCWDIAELITLFGCGKRHGGQFRRGIHPGAHVGVNLILWLLGIICIFLSVLSYVTARSQLASCQEAKDSDSSTSYYGYYYYYCDDDEYSMLSSGLYIPALRAIEAFVALLTLDHFIFFVLACIETNQRNKSRAAVMMMPPQMYYNPGMAPYGYPMMPPQAYMGQTQQIGQMEKSPAAATHPQTANPGPGGYYAPAAPVAAQRTPETPLPAAAPAAAPAAGSSA